MITTMQDILNEAIPIWEKRPSAGMCYAIYALCLEGKISLDMASAATDQLMKYTREISPHSAYLEEALFDRYGYEGIRYYFEVFKDWDNRRRPTRWQNFWYRLKRVFL